jgi:predicted nucleic acid-binding protein
MALALPNKPTSYYARVLVDSVIICDTAPLVAAALYRDPDHHRCVELFTGLRLANRKMLLPAPIIAEVGYLLAAKAGAHTEADFLRAVAVGDFVPVELVIYYDSATWPQIVPWNDAYHSVAKITYRRTTADRLYN